MIDMLKPTFSNRQKIASLSQPIRIEKTGIMFKLAYAHRGTSIAF